MDVSLSKQFVAHDWIKAREVKWRSRGRSYQSWIRSLLEKFEDAYSTRSLSTIEKNNYAILLLENGRTSEARDYIESAWQEFRSGSTLSGPFRTLGQNRARIRERGMEGQNDLEALEPQPVKHPFERGAFIGATGNSGTTLLQNVLNDHPEINSFGETYLLGHPLFVAFCRHAHALGVEERISALNELKRYLLTGYFQNPPADDTPFQWGLDQFFSRRRIRESFSFLNGAVDVSSRREVNTAVRKAMRYLFDHLTRERDGTVWIEKTPKNLLRLDLLTDLFPDTLFIQIYRDPRDVICSRRRKAENPPFASGENASEIIDRNWTNWMLPGCRQLGKNDIASYISFSYEEFVNRPEPWLRSITNELDVSFSDRMMETEFRRGSVGRHKEELGASGKTYLETKYGAFLEILGYEHDRTETESLKQVFQNTFRDDADVPPALGGLLETVYRGETGEGGEKPRRADEESVAVLLERMNEREEAFGTGQRHQISRLLDEVNK